MKALYAILEAVSDVEVPKRETSEGDMGRGGENSTDSGPPLP